MSKQSSLLPVEIDMRGLLLINDLVDEVPGESSGSSADPLWPCWTGWRPDTVDQLVCLFNSTEVGQSDIKGKNTLYESRFQVQVRSRDDLTGYRKSVAIRNFLHTHIPFILERGQDFTRLEYQGIHCYVEPFRLLREGSRTTWAADFSAFRAEN
jgi:hypothetical protein